MTKPECVRRTPIPAASVASRPAAASAARPTAPVIAVDRKMPAHAQHVPIRNPVVPPRNSAPATLVTAAANIAAASNASFPRTPGGNSDAP